MGREVVKVFHSFFCITAITNHIENEGYCNSFSLGKKKKNPETIFNIIAQTVSHYTNVTCQNVETYLNLLLGSSHLFHYLCNIYCNDHSIHIRTINTRLALELTVGKERDSTSHFKRELFPRAGSWKIKSKWCGWSNAQEITRLSYIEVIQITTLVQEKIILSTLSFQIKFSFLNY